MTLPTSPMPQPAGSRPPRPAGWAYAAVQTLSAVGLLVGLYLVLGFALALVIASGVAFVGSIALEILGRRPPRPVVAPAPGGDR